MYNFLLDIFFFSMDNPLCFLNLSVVWSLVTFSTLSLAGPCLKLCSFHTNFNSSIISDSFTISHLDCPPLYPQNTNPGQPHHSYLLSFSMLDWCQFLKQFYLLPPSALTVVFDYWINSPSVCKFLKNEDPLLFISIFPTPTIMPNTIETMDKYF